MHPTPFHEGGRPQLMAPRSINGFDQADALDMPTPDARPRAELEWLGLEPGPELQPLQEGSPSPTTWDSSHRAQTHPPARSSRSRARAAAVGLVHTLTATVALPAAPQGATSPAPTSPPRRPQAQCVAFRRARSRAPRRRVAAPSRDQELARRAPGSRLGRRRRRTEQLPPPVGRRRRSLIHSPRTPTPADVAAGRGSVSVGTRQAAQGCASSAGQRPQPRRTDSRRRLTPGASRHRLQGAAARFSNPRREPPSAAPGAPSRRSRQCSGSYGWTPSSSTVRRPLEGRVHRSDRNRSGRELGLQHRRRGRAA